MSDRIKTYEDEHILEWMGAPNYGPRVDSLWTPVAGTRTMLIPRTMLYELARDAVHTLASFRRWLTSVMRDRDSPYVVDHYSVDCPRRIDQPWGAKKYCEVLAVPYKHGMVLARKSTDWPMVMLYSRMRLAAMTHRPYVTTGWLGWEDRVTGDKREEWLLSHRILEAGEVKAAIEALTRGRMPLAVRVKLPLPWSDNKEWWTLTRR